MDEIDTHTLMWTSAHTARCCHPYCTWNSGEVVAAAASAEAPEASAVAGPRMGDWNKEVRRVAVAAIRRSYREHHR